MPISASARAILSLHGTGESGIPSAGPLARVAITATGDGQSLPIGPPASPPPGGPNDVEVATLVDLVNAHWRSVVATALTWHATATQVALEHSQDMTTRGFFSHVNPAFTHHGVGRYGTLWTHVFFTPPLPSPERPAPARAQPIRPRTPFGCRRFGLPVT